MIDTDNEAVEFLNDWMAKNNISTIEKDSLIYKGLLAVLIPIKLEMPYNLRKPKEI